jgi:hypothetical protein
VRPTSATSNLSCFENQINIDGDMVRNVVTKLSGDWTTNLPSLEHAFWK